MAKSGTALKALRLQQKANRRVARRNLDQEKPHSLLSKNAWLRFTDFSGYASNEKSILANGEHPPEKAGGKS
jgi:hypothetical protein